MNPKPKIVLIEAVLTFRITQMGKRDFPDLVEHARPFLRSLGFDTRQQQFVIVPDHEEPDEVFTLTHHWTGR